MEELLLKSIDVGKKMYGNAAGLSRASGVSAANISRWRTKKQSPRLVEFAPILEAVGVQLLFRKEELIDYDLVPKVAAKAGAGASLETSGEREGLYAFRKDFLARENISVRNAVLMDVVGNSMEPEFSEGDTLLVDTSDTEIRDGKIYVVTLGEELRVKRIYTALSGLILRSDNRRYPDIHVEGADLESFFVRGRVRWHSRIL